jgi:antitoxin MazE6
MKTTVLIPDEVFETAECLARHAKKSRSRLYADALKEYLARHSPDKVTDAMNAACDEIGDTKDAFVSVAARRVLEQSDW